MCVFFFFIITIFIFACNLILCFTASLEGEQSQLPSSSLVCRNKNDLLQKNYTEADKRNMDKGNEKGTNVIGIIYYYLSILNKL